MNMSFSPYRAVAVVPWLWLGLFYAFVLRARMFLGRWPAPYRPDPKELGFHGHSLAVYLVFLCVPLAVLVWSLLTTYRLRKKEPVVRPAAAFWTGVALIIVAVTVDPGNFVEWFLD